jgi:hypothetical protein
VNFGCSPTRFFAYCSLFSLFICNLMSLAIAQLIDLPFYLQHSLIFYPPARSPTRSLTHPLAHPPARSPTRSLIHPLAHSQIIAIGVGTRYSATELQQMASSNQYVYTLKSFSRIPAIVDKITDSACRSRPVLDSGASTDGEVEQCEFVFFRSQCGELQNSVIEVVSTSGMVHVFVDNQTNPGPFRYVKLIDPPPPPPPLQAHCRPYFTPLLSSEMVGFDLCLLS